MPTGVRARNFPQDSAVDAHSQLALQEEPSYLDYLAYLLQEELRGRDETQVKNGLKAANFPMHARLEDFDFSFQTNSRRDRPVAMSVVYSNIQPGPMAVPGRATS